MHAGRCAADCKTLRDTAAHLSGRKHRGRGACLELLSGRWLDGNQDSKLRLGRFWGPLGSVLGALGCVLARSLGVLGGIVVNLQKPTKTLGKSRILGVPGASWGVLGASWSVLDASWGPLAASWGPPGGGLGHLGPLLGRLRRVLRRLGRVLGCLGASWARPGRIWVPREGGDRLNRALPEA